MGDPDDVADGRRRRRATNRQAVLEALVALFGEGEFQPGTAAIAARAGISERSLFRYFDDLDELVRAAIEHNLSAARPLLDHEVAADLPTEEKIAAVLAARSRLYEATAPSARAARASAHRHPAVASQIAEARRYLRDQLRRTFAPELAGGLEDRLPALDALCSFESYELLRRDQAMSIRRTVDALTTAVGALLAPAGVLAR